MVQFREQLLLREPPAEGVGVAHPALHELALVVAAGVGRLGLGVPDQDERAGHPATVALWTGAVVRS